MANDAIILSLDSLKFTWTAVRTMRAYLVGIAADNLGTVQVMEPPSSTFVKHRPLLGRPFSWPLAFDGFAFYQRTGGLPDIVAFSLMIVRDRRAARRAGEVLSSIGKSNEFKRLLGKASTLIASAGAGSAASNIVSQAVLAPLVNLVGNELRNARDKLLDTINGSMHFDTADKKKNEIGSKVTGAIAELEFDFHLFDAAVDTDSAIELQSSLSSLRQRGLLIGSTPGS